QANARWYERPRYIGLSARGTSSGRGRLTPGASPGSRNQERPRAGDQDRVLRLHPLSHPRTSFLQMNRISHVFPDVETLLEDLRPKRPVEGLLVNRVGLIELLQSSLVELHEHRRRAAGTPAEPETVHRIKYWDDIL